MTSQLHAPRPSWIAVLALLCGLALPGCPVADPGDDDDDATGDDDTGDPGTIPLAGTCGLSDRRGGFVVEAYQDYSIVDGTVEDGTVPISVLEEVAAGGGCRLMKRNNPFCDPPCEGDETCDFDGTGGMVSVNNQGSLVRHTIDGEMSVIKPNLTNVAAGTEILPNGDFVVCDVAAGSVVRVTPEGATTTLVSGLSYPNGIEVGLDGYVYVSEHDAGRVRRVDPDTGDYTIIADGLINPNGLAFGPGHETLYVNSFGGGTVHAIEHDGGDDWSTTLYGEMGAAGAADACEGLVAGDECFLSFGIGICDGAPANLTCVEHLDELACAGLSQGDPCETSALGETLDSVCVTSNSVTFCPKVPGEVASACFGKSSGDSCEALGIPRTCDPSWEAILICDITSWETEVFTACDGLDEGDECVVVDYEGYGHGECEDTWQGMQCDASWGGGWGDGGLLDGLNVDVCGNVYVTEYIAGYIWRFREWGGTPELIAETDTEWIPNMKWGYGIGGWETDVMYVSNRDTRGMIAVELGIPGKETALEP